MEKTLEPALPRIGKGYQKRKKKIFEGKAKRTEEKKSTPTKGGSQIAGRGTRTWGLRYYPKIRRGHFFGSRLTHSLEIKSLTLLTNCASQAR